jgi:predicted transcriptional regulator
MARTTIKATYSLAPDVVGQLERLAETWKVSKSAALARAIIDAARTHPPDDQIASALASLHELQQVARVSEAEAAAWIEQSRDGRCRSRRVAD